MKQSPIVVIAVVFLWLAIAGEAERCLVEFQEADGAKLAELTLDPSSGASCDAITSVRQMYDATTLRTSAFASRRGSVTTVYRSKEAETFDAVRLEHYLNSRGPRDVGEYRIKRFLDDWIDIAWLHVSSPPGDAIVFKVAAEESLEMHETLAGLMPLSFPAGRDPLSVFLDDYSKKPRESSHGYMLRVEFEEDLRITAVFDLDKPIDSGSELWEQVLEVEPKVLLVRYWHFEDYHAIATYHWKLIMEVIRDSGPPLRDTDASPLPLFKMNFRTLAQVQKYVEEADNPELRKSRPTTVLTSKKTVKNTLAYSSFSFPDTEPWNVPRRKTRIPRSSSRATW